PPNGCRFQDAAISPFISKLMDLPRPQPGHHSIPKWWSGHKLKWLPCGSIHQSAIKARHQNISSSGKLVRMLDRVFIARKYTKRMPLPKMPIGMREGYF